MEKADSKTSPKPATLDRPVARFLALGVFLGAALTLAWVHRDDLIPPQAEAAPTGDDPVALCLAKRAVDIDRMRGEGVIDDGQAVMFKDRAEALCIDQHGEGAGPPPRN